MIKINLIPHEILADQEKKLRILQAGAMASILAFFIALLSAWRWNTEHSLEVHRETIRAELNKVNDKVKKVEDFEKTLAAVQSRLDVINNLLKGRLLNPYFMEDFARSLVTGIWVTNMNTSNAGLGLKLTVTAKALEKDQIANWLRTLESYGNTVDSAATPAPAAPPAKGPGAKVVKPPPNRFTEIELGGINATNEDGKQIYTFSVTMTYQNPKL
jgi:Tfp pilus assembly protein PilN